MVATSLISCFCLSSINLTRRAVFIAKLYSTKLLTSSRWTRVWMVKLSSCICSWLLVLSYSLFLASKLLLQWANAVAVQGMVNHFHLPIMTFTHYGTFKGWRPELRATLVPFLMMVLITIGCPSLPSKNLVRKYFNSFDIS